MAKSAVKNTNKVAEFVKRIQDGLEQWDKVYQAEKDKQKVFKILIGLMVLRDFIKKTFHNAVSYSVLNNNHDMKCLSTAGKTVFAHVPNKEVWEDLDKTAAEQMNDDAVKLVKKMMAEPLGDSELKQLAEIFHASPEFLKLDGELVRGMGFTEDLCGTNEDVEAYQITQILQATKNFNYQYIKEKLSNVKFVVPWVVMYRGRT